ncbi:MAG: PEPxxWA-CTERM sorting domain-containing protein [Sphingomonas sp.]|nr:PEPxxWA-CTERM sorting domain-containing protein [Sphingomonas sp.]
MTKIRFFIALCAAMMFAAPANAATFLYTLTGSGGTPIVKFTLDSLPTPNNSSASGFRVNGVLVSVGPLSALRSIVFLTTGGLQIRNGSTVVLGLGATSNDRLFTGLPGDPVMKSGSFSLTGTSGAFSLLVAAIPEPATWAMLILGFGVIGFGMRSQRSRPRHSVALA